MQPQILVIVGPTASGKSALGVKIARKLNGEIISADSRQVYKGLDIGTGKITHREMQRVPHHLLDVASPKKIFNASDFKRLGLKALNKIQKSQKLPVIVGGTGFYIDTLLGRVSLAEVEPDLKLRKRLSTLTAPELYTILQEKDPVRAQAIDKNNPVRLVRAIEIATHTSHAKVALQEPLKALWIGISPDKELLYKKIHDRLLTRMKQGMLREAKSLHAQGLSWKRMEELGLEYRYLALHLQGKISKEEMVNELETKIGQYAKRQITYWKRNKEIKWFEDAEKAEAAIHNLYKQNAARS